MPVEDVDSDFDVDVDVELDVDVDVDVDVASCSNYSCLLTRAMTMSVACCSENHCIH